MVHHVPIDAMLIMIFLSGARDFSFPLKKKKILDVFKSLTPWDFQISLLSRHYTSQKGGPADLHNLTYSFILTIMSLAGEAWCRKILAFCFLQISQVASRSKEAKALRAQSFFETKFYHHDLIFGSLIQSVGQMSMNPHQGRIEDQILLNKRHWKRRWAAYTLYDGHG